MSHKTFQETFDSNPNISIKALHRQNLVTFDKTFMINHQLTPPYLKKQIVFL